MRISPCDLMMTKYWHNNYDNTQSKTRCPLKCVEVIGPHCSKKVMTIKYNLVFFSIWLYESRGRSIVKPTLGPYYITYLRVVCLQIIHSWCIARNFICPKGRGVTKCVFKFSKYLLAIDGVEGESLPLWLRPCIRRIQRLLY